MDAMTLRELDSRLRRRSRRIDRYMEMAREAQAMIERLEGRSPDTRAVLRRRMRDCVKEARRAHRLWRSDRALLHAMQQGRTTKRNDAADMRRMIGMLGR